MEKDNIFKFSESKLKVDSLQQRVYDRIKRLILTNRLRPGQNIIIDQLANELGISHTPIREALAMLKLDGLVSTGYHKTPKVTDIDEDDVREIYEVRMMIEGYAIRQVTGSLTDEDLFVLKKTIGNLETITNPDIFQESLAQADVDFHGLITSRLKNNIFLRIFGYIEDLSLRIRTLVMANSAEKIDVIKEEHYAIYKALEMRDPEMAYNAMIMHLTSACERTVEALDHIESLSE